MSEAKTTPKKYNKTAFISAVKDTKERLILEVVLEDNASYTKQEAEKLVEEWKNKKVNAKQSEVKK